VRVSIYCVIAPLHPHTMKSQDDSAGFSKFVGGKYAKTKSAIKKKEAVVVSRMGVRWARITGVAVCSHDAEDEEERVLVAPHTVGLTIVGALRVEPESEEADEADEAEEADEADD
jgi:hypothetical protein